MSSKELSSVNSLGFKNIRILKAVNVNDFLFLSLDNGKRVLSDGNGIIDVSKYDYLANTFNMGSRKCVALKKGFSTSVIDFETEEVLFEDQNAYHVSREDDRVLHVIMHIGVGNNTLYDIETKKYLQVPENYEFEHSLGNNLYVFVEKNSEQSFHNLKRLIVNAGGEILLKDIEGWIEISGDYVIVKKQNGFCIINKKLSSINTIEQNDQMIAKPAYHEGNIIILEKALIKIFTLDLKLAKQFEVSELESVVDYEFVGDTLKLCLAYDLDSKKINRHLFFNIGTGKSISHLRIEGYPYWLPETYIGKDSIKDEDGDSLNNLKDVESSLIDYHFYDSNFDKMFSIKGKFLEEISDSIFVIGNIHEDGVKRKFINTKTGVIKDSNYDIIQFDSSETCGYGFNIITGMMDIFDENLNVMVPNIDYKALGLSKTNGAVHNFEYFALNGYACIIKIIHAGSHDRYRYIIQKASGEIVFDSMEHRCYKIGNLIQIVKDGKSEFLDTLTGQIGILSMNVPVDENGQIDFKRVTDSKSIFRISEARKLLPSALEERPSVKAIIFDY